LIGFDVVVVGWLVEAAVKRAVGLALSRFQ
jgi:hypothetical protein